MLVTTPDNPIPKVGQILYKEYKSEDGKFQYASLVFVDQEIKEGKQWMYTQIANMEDFGKGLEVYIGFESGGMPQSYTRIATDEDILKFITMMKNGKIAEGPPDFNKWLDEINKDTVLLTEEKERITKLSG